MTRASAFCAAQVLGLVAGILAIVTSRWLETPSGLLGIKNAGLWNICSAGDNSTVLALLEREIRSASVPAGGGDPKPRAQTRSGYEPGAASGEDPIPASPAAVTASEGPAEALRVWLESPKKNASDVSLVTEVRSSLPWSSDPYCTTKNVELFWRQIRDEDFWGYIQAVRALGITSLVAGGFLAFSLACAGQPRNQIAIGRDPTKSPSGAHFWWAVQVGTAVVAMFIFLGMIGRIVGAGLDVSSFNTYGVQYKKVKDFIGWSYWVFCSYTGWSALVWLVAMLRDCT